MRARDPFNDPAELIRRVYAYVAYRLGDGPDAEDVTSAAMERALRYKGSYDRAKGEPAAWLVGIARTCVDDHLRSLPRTVPLDGHEEARDRGDATLDRIAVLAAVATLEPRDRELVALRYGAELGSRDIGRVLGMSPGAVDVALHRCRSRLKELLGEPGRSVESVADGIPNLAVQSSG